MSSHTPCQQDPSTLHSTSTEELGFLPICSHCLPPGSLREPMTSDPLSAQGPPRHPPHPESRPSSHNAFHTPTPPAPMSLDVLCDLVLFLPPLLLPVHTRHPRAFALATSSTRSTLATIAPLLASSLGGPPGHLTLNNSPWNFPGGPVVKTLCSHCGGQGLIPGWGTEIPNAMQCGRKNINHRHFPNTPTLFITDLVLQDSLCFIVH